MHLVHRPQYCHNGVHSICINTVLILLLFYVSAPRTSHTRYFDDWWPESGGFPDPYTNMTQDMGLTAAMQLSISKSYQANMAVIYAEILKRGMFTWQQQWNGQSSPTAKNGCCTKPLVKQGSTCAPTLRKLCAKGSPAQTRVLNYVRFTAPPPHPTLTTTNSAIHCSVPHTPHR